jgi:hypothetical protein
MEDSCREGIDEGRFCTKGLADRYKERTEGRGSEGAVMKEEGEKEQSQGSSGKRKRGCVGKKSVEKEVGKPSRPWYWGDVVIFIMKNKGV